MLKHIILLTLLSLVSLHAGVTLTLTTDLGAAGGDLVVTPGQLTGWGFSFLNAVDFASLTSAAYVHTGGTVTGSNLADFIGPQGIVIGASPEPSLVTQAFNAGTFRGTGTFQVSPAAVAGDVSSGYVQVTYDLFSVSPNNPLFDPTTDGISFGNFAVAPASLTVIAGGPAAVPEPATGLLAGLALLGLGVLGKRR
ncbi:MAG: PEP-CTERM sorting domain-containing protein [Acidobacteria bacterium]|nr:PEP-CTERM sorting domain-containing protein [Acidobacteriota bacterium]